jgi:hypothetical protein
LSSGFKASGKDNKSSHLHWESGGGRPGFVCVTAIRFRFKITPCIRTLGQPNLGGRLDRQLLAMG